LGSTKGAVVIRHFLFRTYGWIALFGGGAGIAFVLCLSRGDPIPLVGSVVAATLGFCYFVQQQRLAETALFKELFTEFNARYDKLNDCLMEIEELGSAPEIKHRQAVIDYFNLCAEEYLFFKQGYIVPEVWRSWCRGMIYYMDREPFRSLWEKEKTSESFYGLSMAAIRKGAAQQGGQGSTPPPSAETRP
jgi:hypothetical protein